MSIGSDRKEEWDQTDALRASIRMLVDRLHSCNLTLRRVLDHDSEGVTGYAHLEHEWMENEKALNRHRSPPVPPKHRPVA